MTGRLNNNKGGKPSAARPVFPFTAIVGQEEMKLALLLNVVTSAVGGVLVMGHRGTGKSTAVRALADLLPQLDTVRGCAYNCDPADADALCDDCATCLSSTVSLKRERKNVPVVELPLGATEDRVCGTIDLGRALKEGVKAFEPGLLARANRGFLYIDEVNLLEDHLVDLLLDVAATGRNRVEREGVSAEHPARFVLVGSGNPEEGELRPQLLDRFGLCVEVETEKDLDSRVLIVERREAFDRDPAAFNASAQTEQTRLRRKVTRASALYPEVEVPRAVLRQVAELCLRLGVDGHRGEITLTRAARALAALEGRRAVSAADVRRVAPMSLRHRLRRDPLEQGGGSSRVERATEEVFGRDEVELKTNSSGDGARRSAASVEGIDEEEGHAGRDENVIVLPPAEVGLRQDALAQGEHGRTRTPQHTGTPACRRVGSGGSTFSARGRYAGATPLKSEGGRVALDATLRAAAVSRAVHGTGFHVAPESLRFKRYRSRSGTLFIFVVDTSGSMALNRIEQAKGALAQLLRRSYVNRDRVALLVFRAEGSELLLPPSSSVSRARALLDALPVGGATPLASALLRALEVARRAATSEARRVRLVVFTDGRANVPLTEKIDKDSAARRERIRREILALGTSLAKACDASVVVDTQGRFTGGGEGRFLSGALGGGYVRLPQLLTESTPTSYFDE
ncbi:MAG: magnesium chelatase subunit [Acidobacteriota bacterium]|jgi:magnesium chelatase subunit D|nr:magnesium chelatase subunit [Acidobacteriota bacterium]